MDLKWVWDVNVVAAYAAAMSTTVFVWDVIKWWRGSAAFRVTATPNMVEAHPGVGVGKQPHIVVNFYNVGSMATTVTQVVYHAYRTRLHRWLRRKPLHSVFVPQPTPQPLPFELKAGSYFMNMCKQTDELVGWSRHHALYVGVCHTLSKRHKMTYVKPIN